MIKNKTILYFLDYGKAFGGAANTLLQQAVLMKNAGHRTVLFFSDYFGQGLHEEYHKIVNRLGIKYEWMTYQMTSQPEDVDLICMDQNYEQIRDKIASYNPDLLHSVQLNPCVELISRELKIPHIMNIYPLIPEFFTMEYMDIFPKYHICDSWYWAKKWHQYLGTDYTCIRTVVHRNDSLAKKELRKAHVRYICAGVLCAGKNQLNVIKAFHRALQEGISGTLSIYGYDESAYAEECKRYIQENNLSESIHIKGFCSDMEHVYTESDVLICGSNRESYPNVISEAMAYGLVVISTPVAGVPELVKDGENGYLTEDASVEAICRKIVAFDRDIGQMRLKRIKENSNRTFEQNHSPEVVTEKLLTYYEHVLKDYKNRPNFKIAAIKITDIREKFASIIHIFSDNYSRFTEPHRITLKLWYLYYVKPAIEAAIDRGAAFYIWGTGKYSAPVKEMVEVFLPEISIAGFIDSYQRGTFLGYTIYEPDKIRKEKDIVVFVAAVSGQQEIISQIEDIGMILNRDYFILSARAW